jgi:hypothetical protein
MGSVVSVVIVARQQVRMWECGIWVVLKSLRLRWRGGTTGCVISAYCLVNFSEERVEAVRDARGLQVSGHFQEAERISL